MLIEYVRDKKRNPIGVLLAVASVDGFHVGWSQCNRSKGDKFDKEFGINIAKGRANTHRNWQNVPRQVREKLDHFVNRANRYYKKNKE